MNICIETKMNIWWSEIKKAPLVKEPFCEIITLSPSFLAWRWLSRRYKLSHRKPLEL